MFLLDNKKNEILTVLPLNEVKDFNLFLRHNFYGIFFFKKASGTLFLDQQKTELKDNSISFYYPYQELSVKGCLEGFFIQFHPNFFCIGIEAKEIGCQGLLFNNFYSDILLTCTKKEYHKLFEFYSILISELHKKAVGQSDMIASQLKIFLINAVRIKINKQEKIVQFQNNLHYKLEKLIDHNYSVESSPEFYAKNLGISITKFNRTCRECFQNSFITVLNLKKIAVAKNELYITNAPIKTVAYKTGFNDPLYFTRVFKKHCGVSPKEFRNQLKNTRLT